MTDSDTPSSDSTLPRSIVNALPASVDVAARLNDARQLLTVIDAELIAARRGGAVALARAFVALHRLKSRYEEFGKQFNALFEVYKNQHVPEALEAEKLANVALAEGFRISVSTQVRASIREGKKGEAYDWLRNHDLGDIIQETINSSTLSAAARELLEGNVELPEAEFNVYTAFNTSVTATKAK